MVLTQNKPGLQSSAYNGRHRYGDSSSSNHTYLPEGQASYYGEDVQLYGESVGSGSFRPNPQQASNLTRDFPTETQANMKPRKQAGFSDRGIGESITNRAHPAHPRSERRDSRTNPKMGPARRAAPISEPAEPKNRVPR